jgi:hypothetical protein
MSLAYSSSWEQFGQRNVVSPIGVDFPGRKGTPQTGQETSYLDFIVTLRLPLVQRPPELIVIVSTGANSRLLQEMISICLISSIKGEVKKKHFCAGWNFSCFSAHWMEQDLF